MRKTTIQDVSSELDAHERECAMYRSSTQVMLDRLERRISRLELMVATSTISIFIGVITLVMKV